MFSGRGTRVPQACVIIKNMKSQISIFIALLFVFPIFSGCRYIVNQVAFNPDNKNTLHSHHLPHGINEIFLKTDDEVLIQCYYIANPNSQKIVVFFHGNAGNLSHRIPDLKKISRFGVSVLGVGYRGYGKSQGKPSEKGIYLDGKAALNFVKNQLGYSLNNIYIFGRSIGTTVAIHTAQKQNLAGLILVAPLTSGMDMAKATGLGSVSFVAGSSFRNIDKVHNISCPVLVIHGTHDQIIPYGMGVEIYNKLQTKKRMVTIGGAGHNNISSSFSSNYWIPISDFITGGI